METQWFPKEVQGTEVMKQGVGMCLLGQTWNILIDYLQKGANIKKHLRGRKFLITEKPTLAADRWFAAQPK
jgi:hypothetical protein